MTNANKVGNNSEQGTLRERAIIAAVNKAVKYLKKDPDKNFQKLIKLSKPFIGTKHYKHGSELVTKIWEEKDGAGYHMILRAINELDQGVLDNLVNSFMIKGALKASAYQDTLREKHGINIPWTLLIDPTTACNLSCKGCWAAEYDKHQNLSFDELDSIISQGKDMGTHFFIYSGGEPLIRKKDLLKLAEKHQDCMFMAFTNGTLIDEEFAKELHRVGNFGFAFSIEGFGDYTDDRRGEGVFDKVIEAMDLLKKYGIVFGFSACYTSQNYKAVGSDEFFNFMMEKGCLFSWLFTYIPIGKNAIPELMVTPEQREYMYYYVNDARKRMPMFIMDFWNDGMHVDGCVAGGRKYLHINANGDVEPCAFIHYSGANIKDMPLVEAIKQPLFLEYRKNQPFNKNHLRPCPLLDNPEKLREMVQKSGAVSTQPVDKEDVADLTSKTMLRSKEWAAVADKLWEQHHMRM